MADDDQPLSALAGMKSALSSMDDDTPLSLLAEKRGARVGQIGAKAVARPSTGGAGKAKAAPAKRNASDSSSSGSSSSSDSSSSDDDAPLTKRVKGASKGQRLKLIKKQKPEPLAEDQSMSIKKKDRTVKEQVVAELLCRWWYALPDWPPEDEAHYQAELERRSLRRVDIDEWEWVPEVDSKGRRKVYELSQFRGLFRNSAGELIDTRPRDTCPCFSNFMKKELTVLLDLLVIAYERQIKDLENSKYNEDKFRKELGAALTRVREKAFQAKQVGSVRRKSSGGLAS